MGGPKWFLGESRGFFGSESVGFFSKCLVLVHLTLLGGAPSQILTLTHYHTTLLKSHNFGDFFVRPTFCTGSIEALAEAWWNKGGDSLLTRLHQIRPITRDQMKNIPSETSPITKDPPLTQLYTYYVALLKIPNSELLTGNTPWTTNGFPLWDLAS